MFDKNKINLENIEDSYDYIVECLNKICAEKTIDYLVVNNIDLDIIFDYLNKNNIQIKYNMVCEILIYYKQEKIINKYFEYFLKDNRNLLKFKSIIRYLNIDLNEIDNYINNNHTLIIEEISGYGIEKLKEENLYEFFKELINELLRNEKLNYNNIEFIGEGTSSKIFGIGSKILKVGLPKDVFKMKNNKLFLQPIYRKEIKSIHRNETLMCVEITEKVDTENITDEDVYYIYKTLRDEGLIWLDHIRGNVGRLLKDNKIYFDGIDYVDKESTDYTTDNNKILPKGSLVIIDNDCIYDAEELFKSVEYRMFGHCSKYEARYREEKNSKLNR